jgi:hypothetical protein
VRVARHRDRERHGRDWQVPPGLERYAHRHAINGAHNAIALVDQAVVADPHAHLRAALGELAFREAPLQAQQSSSSLGAVMERPASGPVEALVWAGLLAGVWQSHTSALDRMPDG